MHAFPLLPLTRDSAVFAAVFPAYSAVFPAYSVPVMTVLPTATIEEADAKAVETIGKFEAALEESRRAAHRQDQRHRQEVAGMHGEIEQMRAGASASVLQL
eukprot:SAG22_NODE_1289_length_4854_cov_2.059937_5_plen_101_part_00